MGSRIRVSFPCTEHGNAERHFTQIVLHNLPRAKFYVLSTGQVAVKLHFPHDLLSILTTYPHRGPIGRRKKTAERSAVSSGMETAVRCLISDRQSTPHALSMASLVTSLAA
ncbi:MAG: hypothetical protein ACRYGK_08505, partial [Janthinobacterium lividum]